MVSYFKGFTKFIVTLRLIIRFFAWFIGKKTHTSVDKVSINFHVKTQFYTKIYHQILKKFSKNKEVRRLSIFARTDTVKCFFGKI